MNLLVPCAGRSSRYHTDVPKYLLSMPDGQLMCERAIQPFLALVDRVCFAVLREHEDEFQATAILRELVPSAEVLVLEHLTRGQAETVALMLEHFHVDDAILLKDSDSYFEPTDSYTPQHNYVSVCSARDVQDVTLHNKSFAVINEQGYIVGAVEKQITSEFFSCGGYFFADPDAYLENFHRLQTLQVNREMYVSQVIDLMIERGHLFHPMPCVEYQDWGTHEDWVAYRKKVATFVIDLDGVIYENGSRFWSPKWGENRVIAHVRDQINDLSGKGNYILIVTSRPEACRAATESQLERDGVKYHQLVMGVHHGTRVLVNDYGPTNPYPAAVAINTERNSGSFVDKFACAFGH